MKIALRSLANGKFVTMWDTGILRADRDEIGIGEEFELVLLDPPAPPPPPDIDPIDGIWPPPEGTPRVRPPDVYSIDETEVTRELRWALWAADSSDDESYWLNAILLDPEPGHTPGWTDDSYWADKIAAGDGAGEGYVFPPK